MTRTELCNQVWSLLKQSVPREEMARRAAVSLGVPISEAQRVVEELYADVETCIRHIWSTTTGSPPVPAAAARENARSEIADIGEAHFEAMWDQARAVVAKGFGYELCRESDVKREQSPHAATGPQELLFAACGVNLIGAMIFCPFLLFGLTTEPVFYIVIVLAVLLFTYAWRHPRSWPPAVVFALFTAIFWLAAAGYACVFARAWRH